MTDATLAATAAAGRHAFGRRQGLWAAGIMALTTPFLYYAKTANVDVPYLFWFALSPPDTSARTSNWPPLAPTLTLAILFISVRSSSR